MNALRLSTTIAVLLLSMGSSGCTSMSEPAAPEPLHKPLMVFLVRHGEKADLSEDAELSAAGRERATELARTLRSAKIEHVHSSDFIRTRDTAAPTAAEHGLEVELYDRQGLPGLAEKLRRTGGRHLVVGHTGTTTALVELLGGEPNSTINEEGEFDRLYIVVVGSDNATSSVMLRYGKAYEPGPTNDPHP